jgi:hypothetical protein
MVAGVRVALAGLVLAAVPSALTASPAAASSAGRTPVNELNVTKAVCGVAGILSKAASMACGAVTNGGALLQAGKQLATGRIGGAISTLTSGGAGTVASTATTALGLAAIGTWVVGGAQAVLHDAAAALGATTTPQLRTTWFSSTYWRMAAIAALLTLPFLFAATVQALLRSDVALLASAALGYLPLAILAIAVAAPITTLLLAASDQLCTLISSAAGNEGTHFIGRVIFTVAGLTVLAKSPFLAFLLALFTIGAAFALWIELLLREAAVYVVVLMLPLAFAALAWPARRIWAIRAVELLVALILSKFAIVAVLSLGGAAISASAGHFGITGLMAGAVLIMLAALSPWALLRLVPLAEIAAGAAGSLRGELRSGGLSVDRGMALATSGEEWASSATAEMKRDAERQIPDAGESTHPAAATDSSTSETPIADAAAPPSEADASPPGPPSEADASPPGPPIAEDEAPPSSAERSSAQPILELGENFGSTPVWPHPDAK